ncbi:hypothetical protein SG34_020150 [Thalassomonas viridans]|uniref:Uncharacterized protein n=1 Tax=Thalassomonas viridans TaxID=137584 RepID=A0AAF0C7T4_9GAMM|nr:hypothetical protein SG34_020150 [Thalassomonas viridans]
MDMKKPSKLHKQSIKSTSSLKFVNGGGGYKGPGPKKQKLVLVETPATLLDNSENRK